MVKKPGWISVLALTCLATCAGAQGGSCGPGCGDYSGDGLVRVIDALLAAQIAVGLMSPAPLQLAVGDVNCDGALSILDALYIAQEAASGGCRLTCCPIVFAGIDAPAGGAVVCSLQTPGGSQVGGDVDVLLGIAGTDVNSILEFSLDGGLTFVSATPSVASAQPNPTPCLAPGPQSFTWDSLVDAGSGTSTVVFRLCATSCTTMSTICCFTTLTVTNP